MRVFEQWIGLKRARQGITAVLSRCGESELVPASHTALRYSSGTLDIIGPAKDRVDSSLLSFSSAYRPRHCHFADTQLVASSPAAFVIGKDVVEIDKYVRTPTNCHTRERETDVTICYRRGTDEQVEQAVPSHAPTQRHHLLPHVSSSPSPRKPDASLPRIGLTER